MTSNQNVLGLVTFVDRVGGTVDAILQSGMNIFQAPYQGQAPWPHLNARFSEVASGSWVCHGLEGDVGGFGPNLCSNPEFEQDTNGWDNTASTSWSFDGTTESWVASASTTISAEPFFLFNGSGSLKVLATAAASVGATSPTGASAVGSIVAGTQYNASAWVLNHPSTAARAAQIRIKWYTAAGTFLSNSAFGAAVTTDGAAWRPLGVTAIAPATTGRAAVEVQFVSAANGDAFYVDTTVLTGGSGATIARDTSTAYQGLASLSITSTAAGAAYAQTPSPATDPFSGIPVNAGEVYYVDCRFKQPNGLQLFIVAAWVFADGTTVADFDYNSRSPVGTASWQYHINTFVVPSNAIAVHFAFAFLASAGAQVLNIDNIKIRQALLNPGAGLAGYTPDNFAWSIGGKQQQPGMALWIAQENDYPRLVLNGYMQQRATHAKLARINLGNQLIAQGAPTRVTMDTIEENGGMVVSADGTQAGSYVQVPRTGYYKVTGKITWTVGLANAANGGIHTEVWRYSSDGLTALDLIAVNGFGDGTAYFGFTLEAGDEARINRDERVYLVARNSTNAAGQNLTTGQTQLTVTYLGDA